MTSEHVDAEHILLMLPSGQLPELRALLLERIGQHQEALRCVLTAVPCSAARASCHQITKLIPHWLQLLKAHAPAILFAWSSWDFLVGVEGTSLWTSQDLCSADDQMMPRRLYVHQMQNPALAEAYCDRMFDATAKQQGRAQRSGMWGSYGNPASYEMYLALIQVHWLLPFLLLLRASHHHIIHCIDMSRDDKQKHGRGANVQLSVRGLRSANE